MRKIQLFLAPAILALVCSISILEKPSQARSIPLPVGIATCQDLQNINNNISPNYYLTNDVDCTNFAFTPIGTSAQPFQGTLDGQGHVVIGLTINTPNQDYVGLFGVTGTSAQILNIGVVNVNITGLQIVGGLVGNNQGLINNSFTSGNVVSQGSNGTTVGGLAGQNTNAAGVILDSYSTANVTGTWGVGGLVGANSQGSISQSYSSGNVTGIGIANYVGGLVGYNVQASIQNSYSLSNVTINSTSNSYYVGGLVGGSIGSSQIGYQSSILNCYSTGNVNGTSNTTYLGALVGDNYSTDSNPQGASITNSFSTGNVTGYALTASLVNNGIGSVTNSTYNNSTPTTFYNPTTSVYTGATPWDFTVIWITDGQHFPIFRWQEQQQIALWNTFSAAAQESTFTFASPPNTINWSSVDVLNTDGANWTDLMALSRPPVWSYQSTIIPSGYDNSVNWTNLENFTNSSINWTALSVVSQSGINWSSVNPLVHSGITWADWATASVSGINWKNVSSLSNQGINWASIGTLTEDVNWTDLSSMSNQGINWSAVSALSNQNVNWDNTAILNQVSLTPINLNTLRTIGVNGSSPNNPSAPTAPPVQNASVLLNLSGTGLGTVVSSPAGLNCTLTSPTSTIGTCVGNFTLNQPMTLSFSSGNNSTVTNWGGLGCASGSATCSFTPDSANFVVNLTMSPPSAGTYTITATANTSGGSISPSGSVSVNSGANQAFTATPNPGYTANLLVDGTVVTLTNNTYTFNDVTAAHTVVVNFYVPGPVPSVPSYPSIFPGNNQIFTQVSDFNNEGITSYNVKRSLVSGGPYTTVGIITNITSASFVDNSVVNGVTYYYVFSAVNASGESPNSSEVSMTPTAVPPAPHTTNITIYNNKPPTYVGYALKTYYYSTSLSFNVYRSTGGPFTQIGTVPPSPWSAYTSQYLDYNTVHGVTYYYCVSAVANGIESQNCNSSAAQPVTVTASAGTGGTIYPSGAVSVNYGGSQTFILSPNAGLTASLTVDGAAVSLTNNTYTMSNVTVNHTVVASFSSQPVTITASAGTGGMISPSGAVSVTYGANQTFTITPNAGYTPSLTIDGAAVTLVNNTYTLNDVTVAHTVAASFSALPPPVAIFAQASNCQVSVYWGLLPAPETGWDVKRSTTSGGPYTSIASGPINPPTVDTNIVDGTTYYYVVAGIYGSSESPNSLEVSATATCLSQQKPLAPSGLNATAGNAQVGLTWNASAGATSYTVQKSTISGGPYSTVISGLTGTAFTDTSVNNGTTYYYVVSAANSNGLSPNSMEASATPLAPTYIITASSDNNGSVSPSGTTTVNYNGSQAYTFTPNTGFQIASVLVDGTALSGAPTSYTFSNVVAAHSISVTFSPVNNLVTFTITSSKDGYGSISPSGTTTVDYNGSQTYAITPNTGYMVSSVSINGKLLTSTPSSYTFSNVTSNQTIRVTFAPIVNKITATAGSNGSISPSGVNNVQDGANLTFTIKANWGYLINAVLVDNTPVTLPSNNQYTFSNIQAAHTINASFAPIPPTITSSTEGYGSISPSGTTTVSYNGSQTYTIIPNTGYQISSVVVDGTVLSNTPTSYTFSNVTANQTIRATFAPIVYKITATAGSNGEISPSGVNNVQYGKNLNITIKANWGYQINAVLVDNNPVTLSSNNQYTFSNVQAAHAISASFAPIPPTITSSTEGYGSISPSGTIAISYNGSQTYTITPNTGYQISSVVVDGKVLTNAPTSYVFSNITANQTIRATFAPIVYKITATAGSFGSISPSGVNNVQYGKNLTFTIKANWGYQINAVLVDNSPVTLTSNNQYAFSNVQAAHTISASFLLSNAAAGQTVSPSTRK